MIGSGELIVILCLGLLLFGGKKLPEFAKNLGRGIREFKKACYENEDDVIEVSPPHFERKSASKESESLENNEQ